MFDFDTLEALLEKHKTLSQKRKGRGGSVARDPAERFWQKVNFNGPIAYPHLGPCWIFPSSRNNEYGGFTIGREHIPPSRFSYLFCCGPIPPGLLVCHKCDTPACVHPGHLFLGDAKANHQDARLKGRLATGERHWTHTQPHRLVTLRGEDRYNHKLTWKKVDEVRRRVAAGETQTDVARRFRVSRRVIGLAVAGRTWRNEFRPKTK